MVNFFNKPATSFQDQIALLQQRGLIITNTATAEHHLRHIGYYRLAGYWQIFQHDKVRHTFIPDTTIDQIIELYNFDRQLRLLLNDAIERIEVSFRALIIHEMCTSYGPTWFSDEQYAEQTNWFKENLTCINKELERSSEEFVIHHNRKYGKDIHPPAWKTMQVLSFGTLSKIYHNIKTGIPEKKAIAAALGLPNEKWLDSWMQVISVLRNYCAHHSRVCYRIYSFPPKDLHRGRLPWIKNIPGGILKQHLYYQLCVVKYILNSCSPDNNFNQKLKELIAKYPSINLNRMGFIPDWETEALWQ
ncbi:Abortive infection bacteriophage resistance protein [Chitinophaga sp. CF118]|uniref:Abi family protein n=1 Tax=Chitinophaga sp. CF118 TaxID=1884367 RepID=UPI0008EF38D6|nr:Abi family protein [Chitinophaga sp. CF118]SFD14540.1 Abortive infection bacteriophage resistance protein [Chitinophaga sp. CF118]